MKLTKTLALGICPLGLFAQSFFDSFEDGNFSNPNWDGDTLYFTHQDGEIRLQAPEAGTYTIWGQGPEHAQQFSWTFRHGFDPSNSNRGALYFGMDAPSWDSSSVGFMLKWGANGSSDALEMYSRAQPGEMLLAIDSGLWAVAGAKQLELQWSTDSLRIESQFDDTLTTQLKAFERPAQWGTHHAISITVTSSNVNNFWVEEVYLGPMLVDTAAPKLLSAEVLSPHQLQLEFNEWIRPDWQLASDAGNYSLQGQGESWTIQFDAALENGRPYQGSISSLSDSLGNDTTISLNWQYHHAPYLGILISELMVDPSPPVFLPEYEYIELHNKTGRNWSLEGYKLVVDDDTIDLQGSLPADSFLLLFLDGAAYQGMAIADWPGLNNSQGKLQLLSPFLLPIHGMSYGNVPLGPDYTNDGGWSICLDVQADSCQWSQAWARSADAAGGSPGFAGSHYPYAMPQYTQWLMAETEEWYALPLQADLFPADSLAWQSSGLKWDWNPAAANQLLIHLPDSIWALGPIVWVDSLSCQGQWFDSLQFHPPQTSSELNLQMQEVLLEGDAPLAPFLEIQIMEASMCALNELMVEEWEDGLLVDWNRLDDHGPRWLFPHRPYAFARDWKAAKQAQWPLMEPSRCIAQDLPHWDDEEGELRLSLINGQTLDAMRYDLSENSSLQDKDLRSLVKSGSEWLPSAWTSSPGLENPNGTQRKNIHLPEKFSPNGDGYEDFWQVCWGFGAVKAAKLHIFTQSGQTISVEEWQAGNPQPCFTWTGEGQQQGLYLVLLELEHFSGTTSRHKGTVVLRR